MNLGPRHLLVGSDFSAASAAAAVGADLVVVGAQGAHSVRDQLIGTGALILVGLLAGPSALGVGMDWLEALYVAVALTCFSTIIIVKLRLARREIYSLHGRNAVSVLIVRTAADAGHARSWRPA